MLEHLMSKTREQEYLEAYDCLLEAILDEGAKDIIKRLGILSVAGCLKSGRRFQVIPGSIIPT